MAEVTAQDIKKVSRLARIEIPAEKLDDLAGQVGSIIRWVEKLNEINTDNIEPLISVQENHLRLNKDEITDGNIADNITRNSKNAKYGYFTVPKVIE